MISDFNLPPVKPCILELTDGGPGVGVSNLEVRFRDAEIAMIHNSDRRARVHRATDDSSQNEAERSNACIGEALVDGGSLRWEYYNEYHGLSDDEVKTMSAEDLQKADDYRMMMNAWRVSEKVRLRIDGETAPKGFLTAIVSEKPGEEFFYNKEYLAKFNSTAVSKRDQVPGQAYFEKVETFFASHYEKGELYMEFLKNDCSRITKETCDWCEEHEWVGIKPSKRTPRPYPDASQLPDHHYLPAEKTPMYDNNEEFRAPDNYQPRAQLKKLYAKGEISSNDKDKIENFSKKYIVSESLVNEYIGHLKNIELRKEVRSEEKRQAKIVQMAKCYEDYDWEGLYRSGQLKSLKVAELDKYIKHHSLVEKKMYKAEKCLFVEAHIGKLICEKIIHNAGNCVVPPENEDDSEQLENDSNCDDSETDLSEDEVLYAFGDDESVDSGDECVDSEGESESDELHVSPTFNRFGGRVGHWKTRFTS